MFYVAIKAPSDVSTWEPSSTRSDTRRDLAVLNPELIPVSGDQMSPLIVPDQHTISNPRYHDSHYLCHPEFNAACHWATRAGE